MDKKVNSRPSTFNLLKQTSRLLRLSSARLLLLVLVSQTVIYAVMFPVSSWIFREAMRANGMVALDLDDFVIGPGFTITVALLFLICLASFWLVIMQLTSFLVLLIYPRGSFRDLVRCLAKVTRKLFSFRSLPLAGYIFLLLPLTGFGFMSAVVEWISIPNFITGELAKIPTFRVLLFVVMIILLYLNIRFSLAVPFFALSAKNGIQSLVSSWNLTRGIRVLPLIFAIGLAITATVVSLGIIIYLSIFPTILTDRFAPNASVLTASISLGLAQTIAMIVVGCLVAMIAGIQISYLEFFSRENQLLGDGWYEIANSYFAKDHIRQTGQYKVKVVASIGILAVALAFTISAIPTMKLLSGYPQSLIIGHRGYISGGVENTIEALEAASAAGVDLVEMDVMETKDGQFVVMHDSNLHRLTGNDVAVKDLTLAEITKMNVHDGAGHTGAIPSVTKYAQRAKELEQPLLIEIKLGGADSPDHVGKLIQVLEENDLLSGNIFHSLDHNSVTELKTIRPDVTVGYIMPVAAGGVPETDADFLVLEEWSATSAMQDKAAAEGLGFFVWTVNEDESIRDRLRRNTDAIITDKSEKAISNRHEMQEETGLSGVLLDALDRFIVI